MTKNIKKRLTEIELRLKKYGFANTHENRVTFKKTINRNVEEYTYWYEIDSANFDVDSLLQKAVYYLNIPEFEADRAKYLLAKTWNGDGQKKNYNKIKYELAAFACLMFCCYEDLPDTEIDFDEYVSGLFHPDQSKKIMKQFRRAHKNICKLHDQETVIEVLAIPITIYT